MAHRSAIMIVSTSLLPGASNQRYSSSIFGNISTRYLRSQRSRLQHSLQSSKHGSDTSRRHLQTASNCQWEPLQFHNMTVAPTPPQTHSCVIASLARCQIQSAWGLISRLPSYWPIAGLLTATSNSRHQCSLGNTWMSQDFK